MKSDIIIEKSRNKNIFKLTHRINRELIQRNVDIQLYRRNIKSHKLYRLYILDTIDLQGKIIYSLNRHHPKAIFNE